MNDMGICYDIRLKGNRGFLDTSRSSLFTLRAMGGIDGCNTVRAMIGFTFLKMSC